LPVFRRVSRKCAASRQCHLPGPRSAGTHAAFGARKTVSTGRGGSVPRLSSRRPCRTAGRKKNAAHVHRRIHTSAANTPPEFPLGNRPICVDQQLSRPGGPPPPGRNPCSARHRRLDGPLANRPRSTVNKRQVSARSKRSWIALPDQRLAGAGFTARSGRVDRCHHRATTRYSACITWRAPHSGRSSRSPSVSRACLRPDGRVGPTALSGRGPYRFHQVRQDRKAWVDSPIRPRPLLLDRGHDRVLRRQIQQSRAGRDGPVAILAASRAALPSGMTTSEMTKHRLPSPHRTHQGRQGWDVAVHACQPARVSGLCQKTVRIVLVTSSKTRTVPIHAVIPLAVFEAVFSIWVLTARGSGERGGTRYLIAEAEVYRDPARRWSRNDRLLTQRA